MENNALSAPQIDEFAARAKGCDARGDCGQIVKEMEELSQKQRNELIVTCASNAVACKEKYGEIPANSMLVHEAIDRALGEDIPWAMKNDLSVLLMQQMDESGIGILSIKNNAPSEVGPYQLSLYSQNNNYLILLSEFDIDGEHIVRTSVNQEALDGYVDIFGEMHSATNCNRRLRSR
ncbi:hypothetical protein LVQ78_23755, partial [Buttiauxella sp. A2-C2_NF]|uniref:DUF6911 family protein n=1 Tax=Buttiauxella ferragutiae TaxID=82989 RepID=UPI0039FC79F7|nr:hypothetical protein [Buttiauxella ferragutiae]